MSLKFSFRNFTKVSESVTVVTASSVRIELINTLTISGVVATKAGFAIVKSGDELPWKTISCGRFFINWAVGVNLIEVGFTDDFGTIIELANGAGKI